MQHRDALANVIRSLGGTPVQPEASYDLSSYLQRGEGNLDSDVNIAKLALGNRRGDRLQPGNCHAENARTDHRRSQHRFDRGQPRNPDSGSDSIAWGRHPARPSFLCQRRNPQRLGSDGLDRFV